MRILFKRYALVRLVSPGMGLRFDRAAAIPSEAATRASRSETAVETEHPGMITMETSKRDMSMAVIWPALSVFTRFSFEIRTLVVPPVPIWYHQYRCGAISTDHGALVSSMRTVPIL